MVPVIRIDEIVMAELREQAKKMDMVFSTPNEVLKVLLGLSSTSDTKGNSLSQPINMRQSDEGIEMAIGIDEEHFLAFCRELDGQLIPTISRGALFVVEVSPKGLYYTPRSTGRRRLHPMKYLRRVLDIWARTNSWQVSDYSDEAQTRNASYTVAVIRRYLEHLPNCGGHRK